MQRIALRIADRILSKVQCTHSFTAEDTETGKVIRKTTDSIVCGLDASFNPVPVGRTLQGVWHEYSDYTGALTPVKERKGAVHQCVSGVYVYVKYRCVRDGNGEVQKEQLLFYLPLRILDAEGVDYSSTNVPTPHLRGKKLHIAVKPVMYMHLGLDTEKLRVIQSTLRDMMDTMTAPE